MSLQAADLDFTHLPTDILTNLVKILANEGEWKSMMSLFLVNKRLYSLFNDVTRIENIDCVVRLHSRTLTAKLGDLNRVLMANYFAELDQVTTLTNLYKRLHPKNEIQFSHEDLVQNLTMEMSNLKSKREGKDCLSFVIPFAVVALIGLITYLRLFEPFKLLEPNHNLNPYQEHARQKRRNTYFELEFLPVSILIVLISAATSFILNANGCRIPIATQDQLRQDIQNTLANQSAVKTAKLFNGIIDLEQIRTRSDVNRLVSTNQTMKITTRRRQLNLVQKQPKAATKFFAKAKKATSITPEEMANSVFGRRRG